jgi:hypothetical protein
MEKELLKQNISKYFQRLPKEAQVVFYSMQWIDILKNISTKYSLNEEQTETLATETTLVLLSIIHLEDYVLTLKKDLKLNEETFNKILDDLDVTILKDIKDDLVNTFELNVEFLNSSNTEIGIPATDNESPTTNNKEFIIKDDEVPLPPYARTITNDELRIKNEEQGKIIRNEELGITNEIPKQELAPIKQDEELKYIPKNVFEDKMKASTSSGHSVTDHSKPKIDPYREEF